MPRHFAENGPCAPSPVATVALHSGTDPKKIDATSVKTVTMSEAVSVALSHPASSP